MNGTTQQPGPGAPPAAEAPVWQRWLRLGAVHLVMLVAGLLGIAYTAIAAPAAGGLGRGVAWVWMALVPAYCLACLWEGWAPASATGQRRRLVVTQALHWLTIMVAMYVLLTPQVRGVLNDNAVGLALLTLLAMGTFLAGVHAWSLPVCATGVMLALAVPAVAWVDANLLLIVAVVLTLAVGAGAVMLVRARMRG